MPNLDLPFDAGIKLDPGEVVTRVIYAHFLTLVPTILAAVVLEGFALVLAFAQTNAPDLVPFPAGITLALITVSSLLGALFLIIGYYVYRHNVLIFTNFHLIQVTQVGIFGRHVSQLSFLRVEDVTGIKKGIFGTIFNFGDVEVQSAGQSEKFIFNNAPDPTQVADDALQIHEQCMIKKGNHAED